MKQITVTLNAESIRNARRAMKNYQRWLDKKTSILMERLMEIGVQEASFRFSTAIYDGVNDASVSAERIENGWKIVANGASVLFIEFGAGVYHNGAEPYPNPRPAGVVNIGEYGMENGKRHGWTYDGSPGTNGHVLPNGSVFTRGNPAAMPMYYAQEEIKRNLVRVFREVFAND